MAVLGCSSSGSSNSDAAGGSSGGSSAGGSGGGGGGATGSGGSSATNAGCQAIRLCAIDCADEACIMNNCKSMGNADAQAAFQALYDCTTDPTQGNCAGTGDIACVCMAQYLQDPPCADALFACVGDINDLIADRCH
jgi:hypothetical protein